MKREEIKGNVAGGAEKAKQHEMSVVAPRRCAERIEERGAAAESPGPASPPDQDCPPAVDEMTTANGGLHHPGMQGDNHGTKPGHARAAANENDGGRAATPLAQDITDHVRRVLKTPLPTAELTLKKQQTNYTTSNQDATTLHSGAEPTGDAPTETASRQDQLLTQPHFGEKNTPTQQGGAQEAWQEAELTEQHRQQQQKQHE